MSHGPATATVSVTVTVFVTVTTPPTHPAPATVPVPHTAPRHSEFQAGANPLDEAWCRS